MLIYTIMWHNHAKHNFCLFLCSLGIRIHCYVKFLYFNFQNYSPCQNDLLCSYVVPIYMICTSVLTTFHISRYPNDLFKRAKIHSVLDWHHSNLRFGASTSKQLSRTFNMKRITVYLSYNIVYEFVV